MEERLVHGEPIFDQLDRQVEERQALNRRSAQSRQASQAKVSVPHTDDGRLDPFKAMREKTNKRKGKTSGPYEPGKNTLEASPDPRQGRNGRTSIGRAPEGGLGLFSQGTTSTSSTRGKPSGSNIAASRRPLHDDHVPQSGLTRQGPSYGYSMEDHLPSSPYTKEGSRNTPGRQSDRQTHNHVSSLSTEDNLESEDDDDFQLLHGPSSSTHQNGSNTRSHRWTDRGPVHLSSILQGPRSDPIKRPKPPIPLSTTTSSFIFNDYDVLNVVDSSSIAPKKKGSSDLRVRRRRSRSSDTSDIEHIPPRNVEESIRSKSLTKRRVSDETHHLQGERTERMSGGFPMQRGSKSGTVSGSGSRAGNNFDNARMNNPNTGRSEKSASKSQSPIKLSTSPTKSTKLDVDSPRRPLPTKRPRKIDARPAQLVVSDDEPQEEIEGWNGDPIEDPNEPSFSGRRQKKATENGGSKGTSKALLNGVGTATLSSRKGKEKETEAEVATNRRNISPHKAPSMQAGSSTEKSDWPIPQHLTRVPDSTASPMSIKDCWICLGKDEGLCLRLPFNTITLASDQLELHDVASGMWVSVKYAQIEVAEVNIKTLLAVFTPRHASGVRHHKVISELLKQTTLGDSEGIDLKDMKPFRVIATVSSPDALVELQHRLLAMIKVQDLSDEKSDSYLGGCPSRDKGSKPRAPQTTRNAITGKAAAAAESRRIFSAPPKVERELGTSKAKSKVQEEDPNQSKLPFSRQSTGALTPVNVATASTLRRPTRQSTYGAKRPYVAPDPDSDKAEQEPAQKVAEENRAKQLFSYPITGRPELNITVGERMRLQDTEFLNDTLLEFGLKWTINSLGTHVGETVHLLNSHFYDKISARTMALKYKSIDDWGAYDSVKRWTKKIDVFQKKFIIVPINENYHWYLAIIVNPGAVLRPKAPSQSVPNSPRGEDPMPTSEVEPNVDHSNPLNPDRKVSQIGSDDDDDMLDSIRTPSVPFEDLPPILEHDDAHSEGTIAEDDDSADPLAMGGDDEPDASLIYGRRRLGDDHDGDDRLQETTTGLRDLSVKSDTKDPLASSSDEEEPREPVEYAEPIESRPIRTPTLEAFESQAQRISREEAINVDDGQPPKNDRPTKPDLDIVASGNCFILTFDSLGSRHAAVGTCLGRWLHSEARDKKAVEPDTLLSDSIYHEVKVPIQDNYYDCGLFLIHYVETLLQDPDKVLRFIERQVPAKSPERPSYEEELSQIWRKNMTKDLRQRLLQAVWETEKAYKLANGIEIDDVAPPIVSNDHVQASETKVAELNGPSISTRRQSDRTLVVEADTYNHPMPGAFPASKAVAKAKDDVDELETSTSMSFALPQESSSIIILDGPPPQHPPVLDSPRQTDTDDDLPSNIAPPPRTEVVFGPDADTLPSPARAISPPDPDFIPTNPEPDISDQAVEGRSDEDDAVSSADKSEVETSSMGDLLKRRFGFREPSYSKAVNKAEDVGSRVLDEQACLGTGDHETSYVETENEEAVDPGLSAEPDIVANPLPPVFRKTTGIDTTRVNDILHQQVADYQSALKTAVPTGNPFELLGNSRPVIPLVDARDIDEESEDNRSDLPTTADPGPDAPRFALALSTSLATHKVPEASIIPTTSSIPGRDTYLDNPGPSSSPDTSTQPVRTKGKRIAKSKRNTKQTKKPKIDTPGTTHEDAIFIDDSSE